ncbi:UDP-glucose 4-epimerase [bacterium]|nr:UDP-glucose 4-epimerase [bacterium]
MKKVFVTGHRGYIGSVLCRLLKDSGYYIIGTDYGPSDPDTNYYVDQSLLIDYAKFFPLDVDGVFHLGANSLLGPSATDPMIYYMNNVGGTASLLRNLGSRKMVFASSAAVYADMYLIPVNEDRMVLDPPNNYGMSKLMCEQMLDRYVEVFPTSITSFRFFNVIGSWLGSGIQKNTPHIVSQLIKSYLDKTTFTINGNDFETYDGTCVRDYVHVVDICRAMIYAYENIDDPGHRKYNLGTSNGYSNLEVTERFKAIVGEDFNFTFGPRRKGDPAHLVADGSKFIEETGFKYTHSSSLIMMILDALNARGVKHAF